MDDDFEAGLSLIHGLFQRVNTDIERTSAQGDMFCTVRPFSISSVLVSVTNIQSVWSLEMGLKEFQAHKSKLCMPSLKWRQLFVMIAEAFGNEFSLGVEDEELSDVLTLSLTYTLPGALQLAGELKLYEVSNKNARTQELSEVCQALLRELHTKRPPARPSAEMSEELTEAKLEIADLKEKVSSLESELLLSCLGGAGGGGDDPFGDSSSQFNLPDHDDPLSAPPPRRKAPAKSQSMSVCNPHQRKRTRKRVKIGE